jgi:hypothetical protein
MILQCSQCPIRFMNHANSSLATLKPPKMTTASLDNQNRRIEGKSGFLKIFYVDLS